MVEISFTAEKLQDAGVLAEELKTRLISAGLPAAIIQRKKASPDTQDVGSIIGLDWPTVLEAIKHYGITIAHVGIVIWEVGRSAGGVTFKSGGKTITLTGDNLTEEKIRAVIAELNNDERT